jgi:hypothetical protein
MNYDTLCRAAKSTKHVRHVITVSVKYDTGVIFLFSSVVKTERNNEDAYDSA